MTQDERIKRLENILGTLIKWMASTSGSPIYGYEATELLEMLNQEGK